MQSLRCAVHYAVDEIYYLNISIESLICYFICLWCIKCIYFTVLQLYNLYYVLQIIYWFIILHVSLKNYKLEYSENHGYSIEKYLKEFLCYNDHNITYMNTVSIKASTYIRETRLINIVIVQRISTS